MMLKTSLYWIDSKFINYLRRAGPRNWFKPAEAGQQVKVLTWTSSLLLITIQNWWPFYLNPRPWQPLITDYFILLALWPWVSFSPRSQELTIQKKSCSSTNFDRKSTGPLLTAEGTSSRLIHLERSPFLLLRLRKIWAYLKNTQHIITKRMESAKPTYLPHTFPEKTHQWLASSTPEA